MHILNLNTRKVTKDIDSINFQNDYHFIVCNPWELKFLKNDLNLSNKDYKNCLSFDEKIRVNIHEEFIFFTLNNFQLYEDDILLEEINIFLSNKYFIIVLRKRNDVYRDIKALMSENYYYKSDCTLSLFTIYSSTLRMIISNQFENLEKIEERILQLEDDIINEAEDDISQKINNIRSTCRSCVKNIRPLTYIMDTLLKDGIEFFTEEKPNNLHLEKEYQKILKGLDLSIDKLYNFALNTRELSDKLLDLYSSKVSEKTNNLITKLTILTGTAVPISIITGIYGMNFKYMPELNHLYGYKIAITIIVLIVIISFMIFKKKKFL